MSTFDREWQFKLRDLVGGINTTYTMLRDPGPKGFIGTPSVRQSDLDRTVLDGVIATRDSYAARICTIPIAVAGHGETDLARQRDAMTRARPLLRAWKPQRLDDITLDVRLPGMPEDVITYFGRPRDLSEGDFLWTFGRLHYLAAFIATDPAGYGAEIEAADQTGTFTLDETLCGEVDTRRITLSITGNGGRPVLTNTTNSGAITFADTVANLDVVDIDVYTRTITVDDVAVPELVTADSTWFPMTGGVDNILTLTGATKVTVTWRPAYQ